MSRKKQYIIALLLLIIAISFGLLLGATTWIIQNTPDISNYDGAKETTFIYSAEGEEMNKFFTENRIYVPLKNIPKDLQKAIVAIEDKNFYAHSGLDFWGIFRAILANLKKGQLAQGGSTITQQLARNALLTLRKTFYRKIQEAYLALQFEHLYTKSEILEMYLNEIFLGHSAYGVQTAARQYFSKNVWELDLAECALIAALPRSPNYYSPFRRPDKARQRRNLVLDKMVEEDFISPEEAEKAKNQDIVIKDEDPGNEDIAPYFIQFTQRKLENILKDIYGFDRGEAQQMVFNGGLKVYTTINLDMQKTAEKNIEQAIDNKTIPSIDNKNNDNNKPSQPQIALVTMDPTTGAIRTMIGGREDENDKWNRATRARRQPGSAFKPFVYTTAFQQNYSPGSIINDMPIVINDGNNNIYSPRNFQRKYRGFVTLRKALTKSINVAAVKLAQKVGHSNVINTTEKLGIPFAKEDTRKTQYSLALGGMTDGVTPLEMAQAYAVFANEGIKNTPFAIKKIVDKNENVIYEANHNKEIILKKDIAYLITNMLENVIQEGTGWRANLDRPVAGKTGTTNENTDAWFVGYTPDLVTSIWIGEDDPSSMRYTLENNREEIVSSGDAAKIWGEYMRQVVSNKPVAQFAKPDNLVTREIDPITGLLPNETTPRTEKEIFRKDNVPEQKSNFYGAINTIEICEESGLKATPECPEETLEEVSYIEDSKIKINTNGTLKIDFAEKNNKLLEQQDRDNIRGTYIINENHPIQKFDEETGLPQVALENEFLKEESYEFENEFEQIFEKIPEKYCDIHADPNDYEEDDDEKRNIFDQLRDLF